MPTIFSASLSAAQRVLVAGVKHAVMLEGDDEPRTMPHSAAVEAIARGEPPIVCHRPTVSRRLGTGAFAARDVLELFAFVHPARFCLPTPRGLSEYLEVSAPGSLEDQARSLLTTTTKLLDELRDLDPTSRADAAAIAQVMDQGGWSWGSDVLAALGDSVAPTSESAGLQVWRRLDEWAEQAPRPPPESISIDPQEARARLADLVGSDSEERPEQSDYASSVAAAFAPRDTEGEPNVVAAESGTGVGKTLGYIAPASLWAERNRGSVWISTYTRNLQGQIDSELNRLYPDRAVKERHVVVRKGRENYLCLLNFDEAVLRIAARPSDGVPLGLIARWAAHSRDGDMVGGDFPGWLTDLLGYRLSIGLTDQRGECIYSGCRHYHKCFIERTVRRARRADLVIANHALVMAQSATGGLDDSQIPSRFVFDEGHHLFDAADSAFSAHLSGREGAELRHWLLGAEEGRNSRNRGLRRRIDDIAFGDEKTDQLLTDVLSAARALPGPGWHQRIASGQPRGDAEAFLALVRQQVYARAQHPNSPYDLETDVTPLIGGVPDSAMGLDLAIKRLVEPMRALNARLATQLDERAAELDTPTRNRVEAVCRSLRRRSDGQLEAWRSMLQSLETETPEEFVDWFSVDRQTGRDFDVGMHRHWIDPTVPFANAVMEPAHGIVITSATLRDGTGDLEIDWEAAEARIGTRHLHAPAIRALTPSPFDYCAQTRVFVVNDVRKNDMAQTATAYRELFLAAGGGALGLFTAISRLRETHSRIAGPLEEMGVALLAQHVDQLDTTSLIEIFRGDTDSCLLGTDAVRDGIDVPGRSLRLIVFDRVPWPRPSILHRTRRAHFGGNRYDDMITRLRLKQAYGRLVRRADDRGIFVILDSMLPSRLTGAFPEHIEIHRIGLAETIVRTREFLS